MKKQIIKVGFDLDGVLLYNPTRIARPIIVFIKKLLFKKEVNKFHYPISTFQQIIWSLLHKSSLFIAPGYKDIINLTKSKKIEAYIISARYEFLKDDFDKWLIKIDAKKYFRGFYINKDDEQPFVFKRKKMEELGLDVFVEDNWDIVRQISKSRNKTKIFWVSNFFDRNIKYKYKFKKLKSAIEALKKLT